jgi:uncharacterized protein (DUF305 family)
MRTFLLSAALVLASAPTWAQNHSAHMAPAIDLPHICLANGANSQAVSGSMEMGGQVSAPERHPELMAGMDHMNAEMMAGAGASDPDVAFVCAMIPHHRGAIAMAKAELDKGDAPFARSLAESIIAAQEKEISEMLAWLDTQM